ncbi:helix-turn-helix domain-containing protein [Bacillaceae bacterium SIJ1]|uniref:response regulator transcription factor n=1 Tax=Litoribacterium kuwaitense TaxID=1398745 RepID=UPI0013EB1AB8|nr:helix-turn-helix domain-containing protein [Litoribacterium kuwaitense]NGP44603.1 helix-turn-helix domain-containing protein [Litoribacterium kuwaitense]
MNSDILSVLVVDDELPIREDLINFDWERCGAVLVGDVSDGMKALSFCEGYKPDIVITDITMPVLDGLKLTKALKEKYPETQVILLTCHSDFDYAQKAIKLGALDYLVKVTLEDEALEQVILKAREKIEKEKKYQDYSYEEQKWRESQRLLQWINSQEDNDFQQLNLELRFPLRMVRLHLHTNQNNRIFVNREVQRVLSVLERSAQHCFIWIPIEVSEYVLFFFQRDAIALENVYANIHSFIDRINHGIERNLPFLFDDVDSFVAVSDVLNFSESIKKAFDQLALWQSKRFYFYESRICAGNPPEFTTLTKQRLQLIERKFSQNKHQLEKLISFFENDFACWANEHLIYPYQLKDLVLQWVVKDENIYEVKESIGLAERIFQASTLSELLSELIFVIQTIQPNKVSYRYEIKQAIALINEQISQPITLASIAEEVGLSPHYISRLFREEVGISFHAFLTQVRMEAAIQLLQTTNLKVYEIAERVGIPSYRYFSAVFRKWTGMTPTDYKKG